MSSGRNKIDERAYLFIFQMHKAELSDEAFNVRTLAHNFSSLVINVIFIHSCKAIRNIYYHYTPEDCAYYRNSHEATPCSK